ncbi:MAG TPA: TetR/AcrR family transcriptional regulator [Polyangiales bacterium]|nr:TetR/AcrR family transcriptional regulator [Polyangiales bacterium]
MAKTPRSESVVPRAPRARSVRPSRTPAAGGKSAPRRRLRAEEAQRRILEAAEKQLMKVGPEGLRLTDLAQALGVSHPAILHHFGSREGLVAAVVRHALQTLNEQLLNALASGSRAPAREELMEMVAEVYGERGFARLLAWLLLSGRAPKPARQDQPLKQLAEAAHALHIAKEPDAHYEDTLFELQLIAIALMGDAIFGDSVRRASGVSASPSGARDFRRRLAALLATRD